MQHNITSRLVVLCLSIGGRMEFPPHDLDNIRRELEQSHGIDELYYPDVNMMDFPRGMGGEIQSFANELQGRGLNATAFQIAACFEIKRLALDVIRSDPEIMSELERISSGRIGDALGADLVMAGTILILVHKYLGTIVSELAKDHYQALKDKVKELVDNLDEQRATENVLRKIFDNRKEELLLLIKKLQS